MVTIKKKFLFFKVKEMWFGYSFSFFDLIGLTTYLHVKDLNTKIYGVKLSAYTVENSLAESADTIFSKFHTTLKRHIKQVEKDNVTYYFENRFEEFVLFFNEFAKKRNIPLLNVSRLKEMKDNVAISFAEYENLKIAAHCYLVDKELGIVSLMHSATVRLDESFDKNLASRINKLLHFKDMLYFKASGFKIYDFGGFAHNTKDKGLAGINDFKLSFGGEKIQCKSYASYSYYLLKKIASVTGLINK